MPLRKARITSASRDSLENATCSNSHSDRTDRPIPDLAMQSPNNPIPFLLLALFLCPAVASGQAPIATDRPGFGDGASPVTAGTAQVELGGAVANDDFQTNVEVGQVLLRYGIGNVFELRGGVGSVALDAPDTEYTGTSIGGKLRLLHTPLSTLSVVSTWDLPTGTGVFDAQHVAQTLKLAYDGALGEDLGLSINAGASAPYVDGADLSYLFIPTLSFDIADRVGGYVGYAGFYTDGPNTNYVEAGATLLSSPSTQLDVNTGFQIDESRDAFFVGLGLAHRF